jgi:hypothetical protein
MTRTAFLLVAVLAGCRTTVVQTPPQGGPPGGPPVATVDPVLTLGGQGLTGYRISAGANTSIPGGDIGYLITANGQGGYSLYWIDTAGSAATFQGTVSTDHGFEPNQTIAYSGNESVNITAANQIDFSGVPGATLEGIEFVAQTDPVYLDLLVDGNHSGFGIYFTGAVSGTLVDSAYNPVAFTSP